MKKTAYNFHRESYGRLTDGCFGPDVGGCGYDAMAMGRGGQGKVQLWRPRTAVHGFRHGFRSEIEEHGFRSEIVDCFRLWHWQAHSSFIRAYWTYAKKEHTFWNEFIDNVHISTPKTNYYRVTLASGEDWCTPLIFFADGEKQQPVAVA